MVEPNPLAALQVMASSYCLPRCLHVVADLGVADLVEDTPRTAAELAECLDVEPNSLARILRLLAAHGVFELDGDAVGHSAVSRLLRSDHPQSMRAYVRMIGFPINWAILGKLEHSVKTGLPAVSEVYPDGLWAFFAQHPDEARIFNAAMAGKAHGHVAAITNAYDFSRVGCVGDIGGGSGHLLRAILDGGAEATGVLFDLPHVIGEAASIASDRLTLEAGDFFHDPLPCCDMYILMEIIHDWGESESLDILRAVRRAAPPHARLLLIETIVPDEPGPDWSKMLDIHMLALLGGSQRTRQEYETLLNQTGFALQREIDTGAGISILEATLR